MIKRKNSNIPLFSSRFSRNALYSMYFAGLIGLNDGKRTITIDHLILGILINPNSVVSKMLDAVGVDRRAFMTEYVSEEAVAKIVAIEVSDSKIRNAVEKLRIDKNLISLIIEAFKIARDLNHVYVGTEHLLMASFKFNSSLKTKLDSLGITEKSIKRIVFDFVSYPQGILTGDGKGERRLPDVLSHFGEDLVSKAEKGKLDPLIGREVEIENIINVLSRRKKNNPLIVGEPGVGKTTLVEGLAQRISQNMVPDSLIGSRVIQINVNKIVAGSNMRGDVEGKMTAIISAAKENPSTILFFDDIHTLLSSGPGSAGGVDIAGILKPELTSGKIRVIGITTTSGYKTIFEDDAAFNRRFQPVLVEEPTLSQSIMILKKLSKLLESYHGVKINNDAIDLAVTLSDRYISDRNLPDKAIDLLDEACALIRIKTEYKTNLGKIEDEFKQIQDEKEKAILRGDMQVAQNFRVMEETLGEKIMQVKSERGKKLNKEKVVSEDSVKKVISEWTGIPISTLTTEESSALKNLSKNLGSRVIGQTDAVEKVADAIKRGRTGISDVTRPWASFLFLGPTGVGKTELAKVLAKELFGDDDKLIQIDMSELMEMHSVSKLIGSPPGYVGYREGGQLTEKVRQNPYSVVLFDEIEKAHGDVLNILLQILEYGHLTDGKGNKVSFKNTVIILTSNVGVDELKIGGTVGFKAIESKGFEWDYEVVREKLLQELKEYLRPELLNRLDDVVVFRPLTRKEVTKIVDIMVAEFNERISTQNIHVEVDSKVKRLLLKEGFDQEYGARPLRRAIQQYLETVVADYIINKGIKKKLTKLILTVEKGVVVVKN